MNGPRTFFLAFWSSDSLPGTAALRQGILGPPISSCHKDPIDCSHTMSRVSEARYM
ncbi:hypothetical protein GcM3_036037 [Golovinomyces cichoracearum]|uniref:Uncharacterized protein n=1 Tax=Golovinomyces cichoracearum TaxID=62708 RepID=A0A420J3E0_9PEZI|nr:hypothetical protein GcM3_036037 [Golovinomyces cichoracearum]